MPRSIIGIKRQWLSFWHRHQMLIVLLFVLSIVAGSSRFLRGAILGLPPPVSVYFESGADPRACTSTGTIFGNLKTLRETTDLFRKRISGVVGEREEFLKAPSSWPCTPGVEGGIGELKKLAEEMPGWYYRPAMGDPKLLPVTFTSFNSVVAEFVREYECKLSEFDQTADDMVASNRDLDDPSFMFCCSSFDLCEKQTADTSCSTIPTNDSTCGGFCRVGTMDEVLTTRLTAFRVRIQSEKERARLAVLRTFHTLRSFELNYAYVKQLVCFQRASLDLRNELGLLADTTSCMPKIWDALTSLHDPDDSLRPE